MSQFVIRNQHIDGHRLQQFPVARTPLYPLVGRAKRGAGRSVAEGEGKIEAAAQAVLDARAQFMHPSPALSGTLSPHVGRGQGEGNASLADLYDPLTMPPALVKAHQALDRAVDACYRKAAFISDAQRVEFLFERYQQLTSLLPTEKKTSKRKTKT